MLELIPLKANSLLICRKSKLNLLNLMFNLLNEAIDACENFLNQNYIAFDAQVGETSCQIRAYKICLLAYNNRFIDEIRNILIQILSYRANLAKYISSFKDKVNKYSNYLKELDGKETKAAVFNRLSDKLTLSTDCLFIILAHFLKKYCAVDNNGIPNAINYNLIKRSFSIGSTPARNLVNHYQALLSGLSCDFILQQFNYCNALNTADNFLFLKALLKTGDDNRRTLPYYYVTKILLSSAHTANLPIIFSLTNNYSSADKHLLFFKKDPILNKTMLQSVVSDTDKQLPAITFHGIILHNPAFNTVKQTMLQLGAQKVILLNAASHPQYAGEMLNEYSETPYANIELINQRLEKVSIASNNELIYAKNEAHQLGCSKDNPKLFYIKHIFCSSFIKEAA